MVSPLTLAVSHEWKAAGILCASACVFVYVRVSVCVSVCTVCVSFQPINHASFLHICTLCTYTNTHNHRTHTPIAKPTELQLRHHVVQKVPPSEWKAFCSYLGLSATEINYCRADYKTVSEQFHRALLKWHQGKGKERSWHSILTAFSSVGLADGEEELRKCILDGKLIK